MTDNDKNNNYSTPVGAPFRPAFPVRSLADIHKLEETPLAQALTVRSTYEIFRNAGAAFGSKTALTFLRTGNPADEPIRWSYAELLARIHQTANLLHTLGVGPDDAVAVLLPGCLEYHLALWGGEAAGIVQPLNPLLTDEKLVALMTAGRAKVLIAYGSDSESGMWSKALRLRGQVPTLTTVLRVAPHDEASGAAGALPDGVAEFDVLRAAQPSDRLVSGRDIAPTDIAAYFHTGGTTGAPKLARHSHGAQVFTAWASVQVAGMNENGISINGYGSYGIGAYPHLAGAHMSLATQSDMNHVAYKGEAPMMQDLIGGQIQMAYASALVAKPHIDSGKIRAIGVSGERRMSTLPDVPTLAEQGLKDEAYRVTGWLAIAVPAKTPKPIVDRLAQEVRKATQQPDVQQRVAAMGFEIKDSSPELFAAAWKAERPVWERLIKQSGAKLE